MALTSTLECGGSSSSSRATAPSQSSCNNSSSSSSSCSSAFTHGGNHHHHSLLTKSRSKSQSLNGSSSSSNSINSISISSSKKNNKKRSYLWLAPLFLLLQAQLPSVSSAIVKEAVDQIKCGVCEIAVKEAALYAKENKLYDEDSINDIVDGLCSIKHKAGRWTAKLDIVQMEPDAPLTLKRQTDIGFCKNECLTVQRACQAALKGKDETLASLIAEKAPLKQLTALCKKTCAKTPPKLPSAWKDEIFEARDAKEVETEDMMAKMKAETGMGMKMYSREDIEKMSEGDMEVMAAREAYGQERAAARMANEEI